MNSISKLFIRRALKTAEQMRLIEDPTISKEKKNKTLNQFWKKRIEALFERNANSMSFYNLNRI